MTLLDLSNPFTLTVRDQDGNEKILTGMLREYTKKEKQTAKDKYKKLLDAAEELQKLSRKIARNERQIEIKEKLEDYKAVDKLLTETNKLEDRVEEISTHSMEAYKDDSGMKDRFNTCLSGDDKTDIIELAERVGYDVIYSKISESINEGKSDA